MYDKGLGTPRDVAQAIKWFTLAADQRDSPAQLNLALFYLNGDGVPKDIAIAEQWLKRAAGNGSKRAQGILTLGKYGTAIDRERDRSARVIGYFHPDIACRAAPRQPAARSSPGGAWASSRPAQKRGRSSLSRSSCSKPGTAGCKSRLRRVACCSTAARTTVVREPAPRLLQSRVLGAHLASTCSLRARFSFGSSGWAYSLRAARDTSPPARRRPGWRARA